MANKMRWRYGDTNPVMGQVDAAVVIEIGDLVYMASNKLLAASAQADLGTKAQNQEGFHDAFVGVAMQQHRSVDAAGSLRVATSGVFEMDAVSATYELGGLVGPKGTGASDAVGLDDQTVEGVATENLAVGRVAKRGTAVTKVLVDIVSTLQRGGPQVMA